jgi:hypothetical protein
MTDDNRWPDGWGKIDEDASTEVAYLMIDMLHRIGPANYMICSASAVITYLAKITGEKAISGRLTVAEAAHVQTQINELIDMTEKFAPGWQDLIATWAETFNQFPENGGRVN